MLVVGATGFVASQLLLRLADHSEFQLRAAIRNKAENLPTEAPIYGVGDLEVGTDWHEILAIKRSFIRQLVLMS